jgi:hypothetical protein
VADAFTASRLADEGASFLGWGRAFGTLPAGADIPAIVRRATPAGPS